MLNFKLRTKKILNENYKRKNEITILVENKKNSNEI